MRNEPKCFIDISNKGSRPVDTSKHKQRKGHKGRKGRKLTELEKQARREARAAKRAAAKMRTPEDLCKALGAGRNQVYDLLKQRRVKGVIQINHRWFIPDAVIHRIIAGEPGIIIEQ
jgi:hypothetical protein